MNNSNSNSNKEAILHKGQRIGDVYEIIRLLGQSAIDDSYLVRSTVTNKRYVLKRFLNTYTAVDGYDDIFEKHKKIIADFIHPNIVGVHKTACYEDDYFIVYSYVAAAGGKPKTLADRIRIQGKMHEFQAKNIFLQICGGIHHAIHNNKKSVVHCDLKPSNILFDTSHLIRISDFVKRQFVPESYLRDAIASSNYSNLTLSRLGVPRQMLPVEDKKEVNTEDTSVIDMTEYSVVGKKDNRTRKRLLANVRDDVSKVATIQLDDISDPQFRSIIESFVFMSPEQKNGEAPDERSNVYSLGLILYFILTGNLLDKENYVPICRHPHGRDRWDEIIKKCIHDDPQNRYPSVEALQQEVIQGKNYNVHSVPLFIYSGLLIFWGLMTYLVINWIYAPSNQAEQMELLNRAISESGVDISSRLSLLELSVKPEGANIEIFQRGVLIKKVVSIPASGFKYIFSPGEYDIEIYKSGHQSTRQKLNMTAGIIKLALTLNPYEDMSIKQYVYRQELDKPANGYPFIIPKLQIELLPIEPGTFQMGYTRETQNMGINEKPTRKESINYHFWISTQEITQDIFEELMLNNPSVYNSNIKRPVERVSWNMAVEFCKRLTERESQSKRLIPDYAYRLPNEKEWEYCCRANTITDYNFGSNVKIVNDFAINYANSMSETAMVKSKRPNRWGLYDMHGNVAEWTYNYYPENNLGGELKPQYVLRGGSWKDTPVYMRNSSRIVVDSPDYSDTHTGFRIVLAPELEKNEKK